MTTAPYRPGGYDRRMSPAVQPLPAAQSPLPTRVTLPWIAFLGLAWLLAGDFLTHLSLGPISVSGAVTLAGGILCLLLWPMLLAGEQRVPLVLHLFLGYALLRLFLSPAAEGIQNVAVYSTFIAVLGLTAATVTPESAALLGRYTRGVGLTVVALFLVASVAGFQLYGNRSFALSGLLVMAALVPHRPGNLLFRIAPFVVLGTLALSLSRTATFVALVLLAFLPVRGERGFRPLRVGVMVAVAVAIGYWLVTAFEPFRERFLLGDASGVGGFTLNTSGRSVLWEITLRSATEAPLFGYGPGAANALISSMFSNIGHPHNDYLRLLLDLGWIGLLLFTVGMLQLLVRAWRAARATGEPTHWTAVLAALAVLAAAITDNTIVYPFVMAPFGMLLGASLGLASAATAAPPELSAGAPGLPPGTSTQSP